MVLEAKEITLNDGRSAILRAPRAEDAAELLEYLKTTAGETHYLIRTPEEWTTTTAQEAAFLQNILDSDSTLMIVCVVDGKIAGNCQIDFYTRVKNRHRGSIGIALLKEFWGLGIGTAMFEEMITIARSRDGILQLELEVIEGNTRAIGLYKKMGFIPVADKPNAIRLPDGTLLKEILMIKTL